MPKMNGTGPDGQGPRTGRGLGKCKDVSGNEQEKKIGKGMGKRRKAGGGQGMGKRLRYDS